MNNKEQFIKEREKLSAILEGTFGVRMLIAFQCIKCGRIFDDPDDMFLHTRLC